MISISTLLGCSGDADKKGKTEKTRDKDKTTTTNKVGGISELISAECPGGEFDIRVEKLEVDPVDSKYYAHVISKSDWNIYYIDHDNSQVKNCSLIFEYHESEPNTDCIKRKIYVKHKKSSPHYGNNKNCAPRENSENLDFECEETLKRDHDFCEQYHRRCTEKTLYLCVLKNNVYTCKKDSTPINNTMYVKNRKKGSN